MHLSFGTITDWEAAYASTPGADFFLSPHWGRVSQKTYGIQFRILIFEDGCRQWILPCGIIRKVRGCLGYWRSMPPYQYGGFLGSELSSEALLRIARCLKTQFDLHTLQVALGRSKVFNGLDRYIGTYNSTQVLDLENGYERVWEQRFDSKQRNLIRKAQKSGLTINQDNSHTAIQSYFHLHCRSAQRWGTAPEPLEYFTNLLSAPQEQVSLWMAEKEGQTVAGIIIAYNQSDTGFYVAGASDKNYWILSPNNLLLAAAIEDACNRHYRWFDFLPSGRLSKVEQFKKSFGAKKMILPEYWFHGLMPTLKHCLLDYLNHYHSLIKKINVA